MSGRKITMSDGKIVTAEEYIRIQILANRGSECIAMKSELVALCKEHDIKLSGKETKAELYDALMARGITPRELAARYGVGVSSQMYQRAFDIDHKRVKKLEKQGVLSVVGKFRFRLYGKDRYTPLYDIYEFISLNEETIKEHL